MNNTYPNKWNAWGVSVKGPLHRTNKAPNQDSWLYRKLSWGNIAVISDGLGSHKYSHIGSKSVCNAVLEAAKMCFRKNDIENINPIYFLNLIEKIWLNKIYPYLPNESSATCLFAIQKNDKILTAQLGDGLIVSLSKENSILFNTDNNFSNITNSFGENFHKNNWKYKILDSTNLNTILMFTDGISDDLIKNKIIDFSINVANEYNSYNPKERYYKISYWLRNWPTPKHTDDKTLLCFYTLKNDKKTKNVKR